MRAGGHPGARPRRPGPEPGPVGQGRNPALGWYLIWARAAVRAGGGERGWSTEEEGKPDRCRLSGSL